MKVRSQYGRSAAVLLVLGLGAAVEAGGCADGDAMTAPSRQDEGSVALSLQVGSNLSISRISYDISGNGFHKADSFAANGATATALIGGIPKGVGFTIVLRAIDDLLPDSKCEGSASFDIVAGQVTPVSVVLRCHLAPKNGGVLVNGSLNVCPQIEELSVAPSTANVGQKIALTASAQDSDAAPAPVSYAWRSPKGVLGNASAAKTDLTCTEAGIFQVELAVSDSDCGESVAFEVTCVQPVTQVYATAETVPVAHAGDAADDPAIWVHPSDPSLSVVIGTDKSAGGGLGVYGLDGSLIQTVTAGELNNVDLRTGFSLAGASTTLVTAGNRTNNTIAIYSLDASTRRLTDVAEGPIQTLATYGSCMYHSAVSGKFYYFVDSKAGKIEQWELAESSSAPGKVTATKVRELKQLSSQPEACVADDATGKLYVGEEDVGIWKFDAEPGVTSGSGWAGELIQAVGDHLVADVEGVAVVATGATSGYILSSNQGDSTYAVFDREPPHAFIKTFRIETGESCIDGVTGSDGIEATSANLGPAYPHGLFVTQDDTNDVGGQNFKLVPLQWILDVAPSVDASQCGGEPVGDAGAGGDGAVADAGSQQGWGTQYCLDFCQKCSDCYATGTFSEGDCHYQTSKPNFSLDDCAAGCAVSATPGVAAHTSLPEGWQSISCAAFDDAM
ncbi:MAG: phytase [Myxococcales bacterium]